ncbi:MAG: hypothetical protein FJ267_07780, partial [Planctomycetes bacterium]|nr:hypothetical protein [Planctomycetota bacterium]
SHDGRDIWKIVPTEAEEKGYGRGVIAGDSILWPCRESILIVDSQIGHPKRKIPLNTDEAAQTGGNLVVAADGGMLLVAQSDSLVAFGEYGVLKERIHRDLSSRPDDANSLLKMAAIDCSHGRINEAVASLKTVSKLLSNQGQRSRFTWLVETIRRKVSTGSKLNEDLNDIQILTDLLDVAFKPNDRATLVFDLADAYAALGQNDEAVKCWQKVLDEPAFYGGSDFRTKAIAAITGSIEQHSRTVYESVQQTTDREMELAQASSDESSIQRVLERFPHSQGVFEKWLAMADRFLNTDRFHEACSIFARLVDSEERSIPLTTDVQRFAAREKWALALDAHGYERLAAEMWNTIATASIETVSIATADDNQRNLVQQIVDRARARLSSSVHLSQPESSSSGVLAHWRRAWTVDLARDSSHDLKTPTQLPTNVVSNLCTAFRPLGRSPSESLSCLLVFQFPVAQLENDSQRSAITFMGDLECLDRKTGTSRWRIRFGERPHWATYAETHLVVAAEDRLFGISLESGSILWSTRLFESSLVSRQPLNTMGSKIEFELRPHWVIAFDRRRGVQLIDSRDGQIAWSFLSHEGINRHWACGQHRIAVQSLKPVRAISMRIGSLRDDREIVGLRQPWRGITLLNDDGRCVVVT